MKANVIPALFGVDEKRMGRFAGLEPPDGKEGGVRVHDVARTGQPPVDPSLRKYDEQQSSNSNEDAERYHQSRAAGRLTTSEGRERHGIEVT